MPALQCYGFVRFAHLADAEGVLEFAQQQGMWADERMLRINWAQGSMPDWKVRSCCQMGQGEAGGMCRLGCTCWQVYAWLYELECTMT